MLEITSAQRRALKTRAHHIAPVVIIGDAGLTAAVQREIAVHLKSHELIKVRVAGDDREARAAMMGAICAEHGAASVQHIGKILVIYRPKLDEPDEPDKSAKSNDAGKAKKKSRVRNTPTSTRKAKKPVRKSKRTFHR